VSLCPGDAIKSPLNGHVTLIVANYALRQAGNWATCDVARLIFKGVGAVLKLNYDIKPSLTFIGWMTVAKSKEVTQ
jgi:hypothetical protein